MKISSKLLPALLLAAVALQLDASETALTSRTDLGMWLQDAVLCKRGTAPGDLSPVGAFDGSANFDSPDESIVEVLTRLGVKVDDRSDKQDPDNRKINYTFPPGIKVFGHAARAATYHANGTGDVFYVELVAQPGDLLKLKTDLQLIAIRNFMSGSAYVGLEHTQYYKPVYPPTTEKPYPDAIVASQEPRDGQSFVSVGCQTFETD